MTIMHKRVTFNGEIYWLTDGHCGDYNLSPLEHYDELGGLCANPFHDISYAIVRNGKIMRFGAQIGVISDLVDVIEINK